MIAASIFLLIAMTVGLVLFIREVKAITDSVQVIDYEPLRIGDNYRCPTCRAFWYLKDEEVHFKGCVVPIIRTSHATKLRSRSNQE